MADNNYMNAQGFNENSSLRASDADRDAAAAVINNALAEGRLTADEHSQRLDRIYAAKTQAELSPVLADLPGQQAMAPVTATSGRLARSGPGSRIIAILSGATRKGVWHPEPVIEVFTLLGGVEFDFREAVLPGNEVTIRATTVLGGVEITVPPEMRVVDNGVAILGGREIKGSEAPVSPDAPVLRIEGVCVLGGLEVRRKARRGERQPKDPEGRNALGMRGSLVLENVVSEAMDRRQEVRDQIKAQRRAVRDQLRQQRHQWRRGWSDHDDE